MPAERGAALALSQAARRRGIGISIDFFVAAAIAKGAPLRFIYPKQGGVNPGQVAIMANAHNLEGARAFVAFLLSDVGQQMVTHADIRKLPVRPSVYAKLNGGYHNPFVAAAHNFALTLIPFNSAEIICHTGILRVASPLR